MIRSGQSSSIFAARATDRVTTFRNSLWSLGTLLVAVPVALPLIVVLLAIPGAGESWDHLWETVFAEYLINTLALLAVVGLVVTLLGVGSAWLVATRDFPGRACLGIALMLPLACPAYVVGYVYAELFEFAGPAQSALRAVTGWQGGEYSFPPIRSLVGAGLVLGIVLYPYVYLLTRATFRTQSRVLGEAARTLGASPWQTFWRVALPVARPAIAGGVALALMETAADFGVVEYFGVPTFTAGIFRTWYALGEHDAALRLAGWLFVVVAVLVLVEHFARRGAQANPVSRNQSAVLERASGWHGWLMTCLCLVPVTLGFFLPAGVLITLHLETGDPLFGRSFADFVRNTLVVGMAAAAIACLGALWLAYAARVGGGWPQQASLRLATLGYALPGTVLGVGLLVPLTALDRVLASGMEGAGMTPKMLLTGSAAALVFAYVARFMTVAFNSTQAGLLQIHPHIDEAARMLGAGPFRVLRQIHVPLLRPALLTGLLLVFIDVVKELPATLILRPFNFETLATRVYRLASDERLAEASTAALVIVAIGLIPTLLLIVQERKQA